MESKPTSQIAEVQNLSPETMLEVAEFARERPIFYAIAERCSQLAREAAKLPEGSSRRRAFERRFRKLEGYLSPHFYELSESEQDRIVLTYAESLIRGYMGFRGRRLHSWDDVRQLTDKVSETIRKRPVGSPVAYRPRILEALEKKLAHRSHTWKQVWGQTVKAQKISFEDFYRQVLILRRLLRDEGIVIASAAE